MKFSLRHNLLFVSVTATYQGNVTDIPDVLIDTGSAKSILAADIVDAICILLSFHH